MVLFVKTYDIKRPPVLCCALDKKIALRIRHPYLADGVDPGMLILPEKPGEDTVRNKTGKQFVVDEGCIRFFSPEDSISHFIGQLQRWNQLQKVRDLHLLIVDSERQLL